MNWKQSDLQRFFIEHKKSMRDYDSATPELLAYWDFYDRRDQQMLEMLLSEEARADALAESSLSDFNVKLTSEVKIK